MFIVEIPYWVEVFWIILYFIAYLVISYPNPDGYFYLVGLITANIGWELYVSFLLMDGGRLVESLLPGILLLLLYRNRSHFSIVHSQALCAIAAVILLGLETIFFGAQIVHYRAITESGQWVVKQKDQQTSNPSWCGAGKITGAFVETPKRLSLFGVGVPEYLLGRPEGARILGLLDLSTGVLTKLDSKDHLVKCSSDGQWLAYGKSISDKNDDTEYFRYHVPTGHQDLLLTYDKMMNSVGMMAPGGDKLFVYEQPGYSVTTYQTQQPVWPVFILKKSVSYWQWMPDGKHIIIRIDQEPALKILSLDERVVREIPLPTPQTEAYFRVGSDGRYLYMHVKPWGELYYYKLDDDNASWQATGINGDVRYSVGPEGLLTYTKFIYSDGPYLYASSRDELKNMGVWIYRPGMTEPVRLTHQIDRGVAVSADGTKIAFGRKRYLSLSDLMILGKR
jgi:hypothetical protein